MLCHIKQYFVNLYTKFRKDSANPSGIWPLVKLVKVVSIVVVLESLIKHLNRHEVRKWLVFVLQPFEMIFVVFRQIFTAQKRFVVQRWDFGCWYC